MSTIVTRSGKGTPLTNTEVDANFTNLNTDKLELSGGTLTGNLSLGDNVKAQFGASNDLQIYHDGFNTNIKESGAGSLLIDATNTYFRNAAGTKDYAWMVDGGAVSLFHNNSPKLATTSSGIDVTGSISFGDSHTIGNDGFDNLTITSSTSENIVLKPSNATYIEHAGSTKFVTTSTGIDVTGSVVADGLTVDGSADIISSAADIDALQINDGTYGLDLGMTSTGGIIGTKNVNQSIDIKTYGGASTSTISNYTNNTKRFNIAHNGDISFYDSSGTSQNFFWDSSTSRLGLGTTVPSHIIHASGSGNQGIRIQSTGGGVPYFQLSTTGVGDQFIYGNVGSSQNIMFEVAGTEAMRISSAQNVNIPNGGLMVGSTTAPDGDIEIVTSTVVSGASDTVNSVLIGLQSANRPTIILDTADTTYTDRTWNITNVGSIGSLAIGKNGLDVLILSNSGNATFSGSVSATKAGYNANSSAWAESAYASSGPYGGGYSIIDGSAGFLLHAQSSGTQFVIRQGTVGSNPSTLLTMNSSGNLNLTNGSLMVGATTAPNTKLQVNGLSDGGALNVASLMNTGTAANTSSRLLFIQGGNTTRGAYVGGLNESTSGQPTSLVFGTSASYSAPTERMRIDSSGRLLVGISGASGFGTVETDTLTTTGQCILARTGGNVGIGTSSPQAKLDVAAVSNFSTGYNTFTGDGLHIQCTGTGGADAYSGGISFSRISADNNSRAAGIAGVQGADADHLGLAFFTHPSLVTSDALVEAMRIDSSGNVLVGTTDTTIYNNSANNATDNGMVYSATDSRLDVTRYTTNAAAAVASFNRTGNDGSILSFAKSGTPVGSISAIGTNLEVSSASGNLRLGANSTQQWSIDANQLYPLSDASYNIGATGVRVKDLYLSGGVYLGGTGAANKLSDFETGSWTPSPARYTGGAITATYNTQDGYYTKVGNLVTCSFMIKIASISSQGSSLTYISGLPYAPARSYYDAGVTGNNSGIATVDIVSLLAHIDSRFYMRQSGSTHSNASADWAVGELSGTITYKTNS